MTEHRVKSWPEFFNAVQIGDKNFELRKNDRNYQVGDLIVLCEWLPDGQCFTGREITKRITYVFEGSDNGWLEAGELRRGLRAGYAILGIV